MKSKINEIAQILQSEIVPEIGLLTGICSQILTCSELSLHQKISQNWLDQLHLSLEEKLVNEKFSTTHCDGLAGVGWLYEYLSQRRMIDYDTNALLVEFDNYLEKALINFLWHGNYDFLHGGVGIVLYFIKRTAKKKELVAILNQFVELLEKISIKQEDGAIKWSSYLTKDIRERGYNISLSHGMACIIAVLSKMHKIEGVDKEKTELLLRGVVKYVLDQEIDKEKYGSYFSSYALESMQKIMKSRMGWCYGDLGIASALYQAGKVLKEANWVRKSLEILLFAATQRRNLQNNNVVDAGLCHGTAGIGHIFYRMWWNTKFSQFKDAADYWFEQTLKMATFEDGLAGYKVFIMPDGNPIWVNEHGLLEGISGIGLTMLTYYYEMDPAWDECLLLS